MKDLRLVFACACATVSLDAAGAEFSPSLAVGLIQTDNLTLTPTEQESATVWHLVPAFSVSQMSNRLDASAAYRMEGYHYDQRGEDEIYNQFDGQMSFGIVPEHFFLDAGATRNQAIIDPESTIPPSNLAISANREDIDQYYVGPTFRAGVGGNAVVNGAFRRTRVDYENDTNVGNGLGQIVDYVYDTIDLSVDNYEKGVGMTWAARYDDRYSDFGEGRPPYEYRQASMELGFWATQNTRVFVVGGKESPWDRPLDPALDDPFWEVGFARSLGEKFNANVGVGERSFGSSAHAAIDWEFDRGSFSVSYGETPSTTADDRADGSGLLSLDETGDYLTRYGVLERYIERRFESTLAIGLRRINFSFTAFDEERGDRTTITGAPLDDEAQTGGIFSLGWKVGQRTDVGLSSERTDRKFADSFDSDLVRQSISATYALGRRTMLSLEFQRWEERSERSPELDYETNVVTVLLTRNFRG